MITIIENKKDWQTIVESMDYFDFYHTYDYHYISKKANEFPLLLVYKEENKTIAIPFLKRPIDNTPFFDLTSVYGYAGPLSKNIDQGFNNELFVHNLMTYFTESSIISVFSRLHPYFDNQPIILKSLGNTPAMGKVVYIDTTKDLNLQRSSYSKSTKNRVNKCRKKLSIKEASTKLEINNFIDIYYENMDRVNANQEYYFSREYFYDFVNSSDIKTSILLVSHNETNDIIAGAMFVLTNNIVQYHLSGTKTAYLDLAPANFFIDEMRLKATAEKYKFFNLGGGLGGSEDSLFNFKSSFSNQYKDFQVWELIVNKEIYHKLSENRKTNANSKFFPLYRL